VKRNQLKNHKRKSRGKRIKKKKGEKIENQSDCLRSCTRQSKNNVYRKPQRNTEKGKSIRGLIKQGKGKMGTHIHDQGCSLSTGIHGCGLLSLRFRKIEEAKNHGTRGGGGEKGEPTSTIESTDSRILLGGGQDDSILICHNKSGSKAELSKREGEKGGKLSSCLRSVCHYKRSAGPKQ